MPSIKGDKYMRPMTTYLNSNKEFKSTLTSFKEKKQLKPQKVKDLNVANVYFNDYIDMQYRVMNKNTERYINAFGRKEGAKIYNKNNVNNVNNVSNAGQGVDRVDTFDSNYNYEAQYAHTLGNDVKSKTNAIGNHKEG